MSMNRLDEILAENQTKSEFCISWEETPVHFNCQVDAKRFWITLLKVVHCNELPKTIEVHFSNSKVVCATSPSPDWSFVANHDQEIKCKTIKSLIIWSIPFRNGPDWSVLTRDCKIQYFQPYYDVYYGLKYVRQQNTGRTYVNFEQDGSEWEGSNGYDFCSKIVADCVKIQADTAATVAPGDFQNCEKLVIEASSGWDYSYHFDGREGYEHDLELISNLNHTNVHLHVTSPIGIVDHAGKHDGARVWRMDDVQKFIERIYSSPVKSLTYPSQSNETDRDRHPNREVTEVDKVFNCTSRRFKSTFQKFFKKQPIWRGWVTNLYYTSEASLRDYHSAFNRGEACYDHMYDGWNEI